MESRFRLPPLYPGRYSLRHQSLGRSRVRSSTRWRVELRPRCSRTDTSVRRTPISPEMGMVLVPSVWAGGRGGVAADNTKKTILPRFMSTAYYVRSLCGRS